MIGRRGMEGLGFMRGKTEEEEEGKKEEEEGKKEEEGGEKEEEKSNATSPPPPPPALQQLLFLLRTILRGDARVRWERTETGEEHKASIMEQEEPSREGLSEQEEEEEVEEVGEVEMGWGGGERIGLPSEREKERGVIGEEWTAGGGVLGSSAPFGRGLVSMIVN
jgi:hypothetical protein